MKVLVQGVVGSTAYGLATPQSDVDQLGIYIRSIDKLIGLTTTETKKSFVQHNPDVTLHELEKYCALALKANPTVLELMYATEFKRKHPSIERLFQNRSAFLSTKYVRAAYGGYAVSQMNRVAEQYYSDKHVSLPFSEAKRQKFGRHAVRLLLSGEELLSTGELTLDVSHHRDYIFSMGEKLADDFVDFETRFRAELDEFGQIDSVLPDKPDFNLINETVLKIRWENHGAK